MAARKPLILAPDPNVVGDVSATVQRLQPGDELDIPLESRVASLEARHRALVLHLVQLGIEIPEELI